MNNKQKQEYMEFIRHLLNENVNNRITPALAIGMFNQIVTALEEITKPEQVAPNDASASNPANMPFPS